jgi:hypothetical protein
VSLNDLHPLAKRLYSLGARGTITLHPRLTGTEPIRVVLQRTTPGLGNLPFGRRKELQMRRHVVPYDPRTPAQRAQRARLGNASTAWHALTPEEKREWNRVGSTKRLTGYMVYTGAWMKARPYRFFLDRVQRLDGSWTLGFQHGRAALLDGSRQWDAKFSFSYAEP